MLGSWVDNASRYSNPERSVSELISDKFNFFSKILVFIDIMSLKISSIVEIKIEYPIIYALILLAKEILKYN